MIHDIETFIITNLEEKSPLPGETLEEKLSYPYLDQGHVDSFGIIELVIAVEQRFGVRLDQHDLQSDEIRTPKGFAKLVARHVGQGGS